MGKAGAMNANRKPIPAGFAETFVRFGWRGVEAAFGSRTSCNLRWFDECGRNELTGQRRAYRANLRLIRTGQ